MLTHARVVVIGGGNMGTAVLYHLALEGWTDCLLLEKSELTSGATWHAAGLVSRMVGGQALGALHDYAVELYSTIESRTGQSVSWHPCGSVRVATSDDHLDWIAHLYDGIRARRQPVELLSTEEFARLNPLYDVSANGIRQALYTPGDGHVDPAGTCHAMAKGARDLGARVERGCRVLDVVSLPSGEWEVRTEKGHVRCEHVVNAGGYHARQIGAMSGLDLPIVTMQHHYVVTEDVPAFDAMEHEIPVTRDDHFAGYLRREQRSALIGLYDKQDPRPKWLDGCPWESEHELFTPDWDNITPWLERFFERCPSLEHLGIKRVVNGGITYTPDGAMILGPAPGLRNYWLACGATVGIAWGPGAGRTLAAWMIHGAAQVSTRAFDPRRFGTYADADYARERCVEEYSLRISLPLPGEQRWTRRGIRRSGAHDRTASLGAVFEESAGWERPRWYARDVLPVRDIVGYRRGAHFPLVREECLAVRERVGLGDFSAFAKLEIRGSGAEGFLDLFCANRVPRRVGQVSLTTLLNERGTIEAEATVARTGDDSFYFVTGALSERRVLDWLERNPPAGADVVIEDRSDPIGILVLAGPRARDVLRACTGANVSGASLPWFRSRRLEVAGVDLLAMRLSFTGELAFELHAHNEDLGGLWDGLMAAGGEHGIRAFGSLALNSLRLEKAYRGGQELSNDATPIEAGLARFIDGDKHFIGREALLAAEPCWRLALLAIEDGEADPLGGEAVLVDGTPVGSLTSAGFGHALGTNLGFAYLPASLALEGRTVTVSVLGAERQATILEGVPYDPENRLMRG